MDWLVSAVHPTPVLIYKTLIQRSPAVNDMRIDYPIASTMTMSNGGFQQPIWPRAYFNRCSWGVSASSFRRGRVRAVGNDHSKIAERGPPGFGAASAMSLVSVDARCLEHGRRRLRRLKVTRKYVCFERTRLCVGQAGQYWQALAVMDLHARCA